jgi:hypothetical protein
LHDDDDARQVTVLSDDERPVVLYGEDNRDIDVRPVVIFDENLSKD